MLQDINYDEKGKEDAELSIQLCPTCWKGHFCVGILQKEADDFKNALKSFEKAFALNQSSEEVFVEYTKVLRKIGVLSEFVHFYKAVELQNENDEIANACRNIKLTNSQLDSIKLKENQKKTYNVAEKQHLMGLKYYEGQGVDRNFYKAAKWYEQAAKNGFAASANNLGLMYKHGQGVQRSVLNAFKYFKQAAENGDTHGMLNLAYCYFLCDGLESILPTPDDIENGIHWLKCAAEKNDLIAKRELQRRKDFTIESYLLEAMINHMSPQRMLECDQLDKNQFYEQIKEAETKGSLTAKRVLKMWEYMDNATAALQRNNKNEVINSLAKAVRIDPDTFYIKKIWRPIIEESIKNHPDDINIITCYVHMKPSEKLIADLLKKFPHDEYLLHAQINYFVRAKRKDEAVNTAKYALKIYPNSLMFG